MKIVKELMRLRKKKFYSFTTACLSLLDESNRINEILKKKNIQVNDPEDADFILVTTCAVSRDSAQNSIKNILRLNNINRKATIYVGGCLSNAKEREILFKKRKIKFFTANDIFQEIKKVNYSCEQTTTRCNPFWLSGMKNKIEKLEKLKKQDFSLALFYSFTTDGIVFSKMPFGFDTIRISKGCSKRCSYCAIPNNRGKYLEQSLEFVKDQINSSKNEYILLIGENIGCHKNLNEILEYAIKKNKKIILRYLEPEWVRKIKSIYLKNIVYIGVPLQSGSRKVLKDMQRPLNIGEVRKKFKEWNKKGVFTGTSVILSYPTENFFDYLKTIFLVIFTPTNYTSFQNFSPRENSPAFEKYKNWDSHSLKNNLKFWVFDKIISIKGKVGYIKFKVRRNKYGPI